MVSRDFETGLDWSNADVVTDAEQDALGRWYADTHEVDPDDRLTLTGFIDFWLRERPDVVKSYRRAIEATCGFDALPGAAVGLLFLHQYVNVANAKGILYEVIASRVWGASRDQVLETLAFAFLHAGPHGMAIATEHCDEYLRGWVDDTSGSAAWPDGWTTDPSPLHSGIDLFTPTLSPEDRERLFDWHRRMEGEVPPHVAWLADANPEALKAYRVRFEQALRGALPVQMVPLYLIQTAGLRREERAMGRAVQLARALGVDERFIVHTVSALHIYSGTTSMDRVVGALG